MKKMIILACLLLLLGCNKSDNKIGEITYLPILSEDVSGMSITGDAIEGREAAPEEREQIVQWINSVKHFERESRGSDRLCPLRVTIQLKSHGEIWICYNDPYGGTSGAFGQLELTSRYQFSQKDLQRFFHKMLQDQVKEEA